MAIITLESGDEISVHQFCDLVEALKAKNKEIDRLRAELKQIKDAVHTTMEPMSRQDGMALGRHWVHQWSHDENTSCLICKLRKGGD